MLEGPVRLEGEPDHPTTSSTIARLNEAKRRVTDYYTDFPRFRDYVDYFVRHGREGYFAEELVCPTDETNPHALAAFLAVEREYDTWGRDLRDVAGLTRHLREMHWSMVVFLYGQAIDRLTREISGRQEALPPPAGHPSAEPPPETSHQAHGQATTVAES